MREMPILFSTEMVKAILDGRKTMTRRVIKNPEKYTGIRDCGFLCPYGQVGDSLWCKEALRKKPDYSWCKEGYAIYAVDSEQVLIGGDGIGEGVPWKWKGDILTGMFMPRWASRITLEVTNIRVERLQDITESDACKEGDPNQGLIASENDHTTWFQYLWDSINAKRGYSWGSNPWVWCISFKRIK
jgi:hypothetical protein